MWYKTVWFYGRFIFDLNRTNLPKIKVDFVTILDLILADSVGIELKTYTALDRLKEVLY
ncbi:hypothetical protein BpHYR1_005837, partial [Brachionus plicatilis]